MKTITEDKGCTTLNKVCTPEEYIKLEEHFNKLYA
jgi:hypothetical protein